MGVCQESLEYLNQFKWISNNIFTTHNSFEVFLEKHLTFSTETHGNVISLTKSEKSEGTKGELIRPSDVISQDSSDDKTDLSSSTKNIL